MSLYERAQEISPVIANLDSKKQDLTDLHKQVKKIISTDKLAEFVSKNPNRAKAEIRSAVKYAFASDRWIEYSDEQKRNLLEDLLDFMFGYGPIEYLLDDSVITEIMVNGTHSIYYEKEGKLFKSDQVFTSEDQVRALIDRILGPLGRRIDEASPMVNARLESGHRVHAIIPPIALDGPTLTIRKFAEHVITLDEMVKMQSFDSKMHKFLQWAVKLKKNIAVSGGTGSGKTTLLNALSCEISFDERVITIEDSAELRFLQHPHVVRLEARPENSEGTGKVTIRDLVINALRMRPDRIVVGECRGAEALDMLQAMNTGHDGSLTTLHANSPSETVTRLTTMVRYAAELPVDVIEGYIASAIDLVIQTTRGLDGKRYLSHVVSFDYDSENKKVVVRPIYLRGLLEKRGRWVSYPKWISHIYQYNIASKEEVTQWCTSK